MRRPLNWLIDRFAELAVTCPAVRLTVPPGQAAHMRDLLRELRARRIAMGREPDDELNAAADLCTCDTPGPHPYGRYRSRRLWPLDCPLHPRPRNCDGEPTRDQCAYFAGECEPDCPVGRPHGPLLRCGVFLLDDCPLMAPDCSGCEAGGPETA